MTSIDPTMEIIKDKIGRDLDFDLVEILKIYDSPASPPIEPPLPPPIDYEPPPPPDSEPPPIQQIRLVHYPTPRFDSNTLFNYIPQRFLYRVDRSFYPGEVVPKVDAIDMQLDGADMDISD